MPADAGRSARQPVAATGEGWAGRVGLCVALLALPACTWPRVGGGGMAETRAPAPEKADIATPLQLRLACEVDRVDALRDVLRERGVLTGRVQPVTDLSIRAQREYYGGLFADAARSLDRVHAELASLSPLLPAGVRLPIECPPA